jgi:hypothetical protein
MKVKFVEISDCSDLLYEPVLTDQRLIDRVELMFSRKSCFNTE